LRGLVEEFPSDPNYRDALGDGLNTLGVIYFRLARREQAVKTLSESVAVRERLAAEFSDRPLYRCRVAASLHSLAIVQLEGGEPRKAAAILEQAIAVQEKAAAEVPREREPWIFLARHYSVQVKCLAAMDDWPAAVATSRNGAKSLERVSNRFIKEPELVKSVGNLYRSLGEALVRNQEIAEGVAALRRSMQYHDMLIKSYPGWLEARQDFVAIGARVGDILRSERPGEALPLYRRAAAVAEGLANEYPSDASHHGQLATCLNQIAVLLLAKMKYPESRDLLERAVVHSASAVAADPKNRVYRRHRITQAINLTKTLVILNEYDAALRVADEAVGAADSGSLISVAGALAWASGLITKDATLGEPARNAKVKTFQDKALALLRQCAELGTLNPKQLQMSSDFAPLRDHEQFRHLIAPIPAKE
jgi:tetratricopeptide (TPR) repeat protein